MWPDYEKEPVEIITDTVYIVHDPWLAQDVATFSNIDDAKLFAEMLMGKEPNGG